MTVLITKKLNGTPANPRHPSHDMTEGCMLVNISNPPHRNVPVVTARIGKANSQLKAFVKVGYTIPTHASAIVTSQNICVSLDYILSLLRETIHWQESLSQ